MVLIQQEFKVDPYFPPLKTSLSARLQDEYDRYTKMIQAGRKNPVWFMEDMMGIKLMDFQKWAVMQSWDTPNTLWLECRGAGKTTKLAAFIGTKCILIPNWVTYISTNSADQSFETFKKIEDIALKKIPSFKSLTDVFKDEVVATRQCPTGFRHDKSGYTFELFNGSGVTTLSSSVDKLRGKRGCVLFDETGWQSAYQISTFENFAIVDSNFSLGVNEVEYIYPEAMPLQFIYASSASDVNYPFYDKYKTFAKKMIMGDRDYFVCDINCNVVLNHSTVDGVKIKSHLTEEKVQRQLEEDPESAEREFFNKFSKGGGNDAIVKPEVLLRNTSARIPMLANTTGKDKFLFSYDPARNYDGSILSIWRVVDDKDKGFRLALEHTISFVDSETKNKTPLDMLKQLEIIRDQLVLYNGERASDWENIIAFYIDAGAGGGGKSAIADQLMQDWVDKKGRTRKGIIDPDHKQYETARRRFPNAVPIVHLIEPVSHKKIIFSDLERLLKLDLISFTSYDDGEEYITFPDEKGEFCEYRLSFDEKMALTQNNLLRTEISYMCCYKSASGAITYDLARHRKNKMHDDRAYTAALAAHGLSILRRDDIIKRKPDYNASQIYTFRKPQKKRGGTKGRAW